MKRFNSWNLKIAIFLGAVLLGVGAQGALAAGSINSQMGMGSRGLDVSNLQDFLASNSMIYPESMVTGYFGQLTSKAVANFQVAYDLPAVGRVGPLTLATLNRVMAAGRGIDISGPVMSAHSIQLSPRQAIINWSTSESASSKVFFDTRPITTMEASQSFAEPSFNAAYVTVSSTLMNNQSITIQNLVPNTKYYYIAESTDASGNVSVSPQGTFTSI
jgi:peptidoglycan hydrolase-like protein with peptidoglycan-binding domain